MSDHEKEFMGVYYDGRVADPRRVSFDVEWLEPKNIDPRGELRYNMAINVFVEVLDLELGHEIAHWELADIYEIPGRKGELRLAANGAVSSARLIITDPKMAETVRQRLPMLAVHKSKRRVRQTGVVGLVTLAMVSVVGAYIFGIPLLAKQIVTLVPPQNEIQLGETIVEQLDEAFAEQGGLTICDSDPQSVANTAIRRFTQLALADIDTPFDVDIQVVNNKIPNAFALPGGHAFYFSGLLNITQTPDEFAGVMAHEIGHVIHRHGMEQLVATAGTGLLVGFVLGDITGLSIAGGLGAALINTSFSREAEREADEFSYQVATKMSFDSNGLPDLLDRIGQDNEDTVAFALLSTHPLNQERRAALAAHQQGEQARIPAFSDEEWQAISTMCGTGNAASPPKIKVK